MSDLPHFIIIGAMRSATSSFPEQLAKQPGIVMNDQSSQFFATIYSIPRAWSGIEAYLQ
jgi:hypothetical protein